MAFTKRKVSLGSHKFSALLLLSEFIVYLKLILLLLCSDYIVIYSVIECFPLNIANSSDIFAPSIIKFSLQLWLQCELHVSAGNVLK